MAKYFIKKDTCLICGSKKLIQYLSLGDSAFANTYVQKKDLEKKEPKAPLDVYFCTNCNLAQLLDIVDRAHLFENYSYYSSTSPVLVKHFESFAHELVDLFPKQTQKVIVDIGSNDGILLDPLKKLGCKVLGVDPAKNMTRDVKILEIDMIWDFFGTSLVPSIIKKYGKAGIVTGNNVFAHTDAIHDIFEGVSKLLEDKGVFVFEVQYVLDLLEKNEFDNTYHEHICYYSLAPLIYLLKMHNMSVFKVKHVDTHGGSLRVYASLSSHKFPVDSSVSQFVKREKKFGLHKSETYLNFAKNPPINKKELRSLLLGLKAKNKKIVGYGAPAKASTLLQYCDIGPGVIDYITDAAPSKQGLFLPGLHIPIVPPELLKSQTPDYIVILAWNYSKAIIEKESWFSAQGGKFIIPVPFPRVLK